MPGNLYPNIRKYFQERVKGHLSPKLNALIIFGVLFASAATAFAASGIMHTFARSCAATDHAYIVRGGDTLSGIAGRYHTTYQRLASYNQIPNPNFIWIGETVCIPGQGGGTFGGPQPPRGSAESIITQVFGQYSGQALRVARCESGLNPAATNPISVGGSHAAGLFQVLYPSTWRTTSQAARSPYDPSANARAAFEIFSRDGHSWREWVCQP